MRTRERLVAELQKVAEIASPENAVKYRTFAARAATGEFDDFADTYDCPITQLHKELTAAGFMKFAARVADGEFDASSEEAEEWANSPAGREAMGLLRKDAGKANLGDGPVQEEYAGTMRVIAQMVDGMFNGAVEGQPLPKDMERKIGFVLMVFPFTDVGRCNYMSNANRKDIIKMLKEQIKYFEADDLGQATNTDHPMGNA